MAVYQISRIQIRRGQANQGTGIPQLASGEMAWAVDTQELYIGNGSVSEGAPAVGNTRILSLNDLAAEGTILVLTTYSYRANDTTLITGPSSASPVARSLQARLDDQVTFSDFITDSDITNNDYTASLQRAIDQLFLNTNGYAYPDTPTAASLRVTLNIPAGIYPISSTIFIPSYATIVGAGADKTIFSFTPSSGHAPAFQFVNDTSTPSTRHVFTGILYSNQPRNAILKDLTIKTPTGINTALQLDSVRHCLFENINITGNTSNQTVYNSTNIGLLMNAFSAAVTCEENIFKNIKITSVGVAVYAQQDILNNNFENCLITDAQQGFVLGQGSLGGATIGQQYGPRQTQINSTKFYKIRHQAVYLERGEFNSINNCKFVDVGNNNSGNLYAAYPQVFFKTINNSTTNNHSDRGDDLVISNVVVPYIPEVTGNSVSSSFGTRQLSLGQVSSSLFLFRLPVATDYVGTPSGSVGYTINYVYKSNGNQFTRTGQMIISADMDSKNIQMSDEFNFSGTDASNVNAQKLKFTAGFLDAVGAAYTGAIGQVPNSIAIYYTNTLSADAGRLNISYNAVSYYNIP